jgi:hypothetical protein
MRYLKLLFERCLAEDSTNSRLMFFAHGLVTALGTIILVIAFIFAKDKTGYDYMVMALGGSGGVAAVGRYMTKKNGGAQEDSAKDDSKPTS